jgi:dynein heavy chain, axonemal
MLLGLGDNMQSDSDEWQRWFDSEMPELAKIPGDYQKVLSDFDRLILLRAMRPDRVTTALKSWIEGMMGKEYVFQDPFDMVATFAETSSETPTFFVLFAGVSAILNCLSLSISVTPVLRFVPRLTSSGVI